MKGSQGEKNNSMQKAPWSELDPLTSLLQYNSIKVTS